MAGWVEFEGSPAVLHPRQVMLCTGEVSSLVWDKVHTILRASDFYTYASAPEQLVMRSSLTSSNSVYVVVNPDSTMLEAVCRFLRSSPVESLVVLMEGDPKTEDKEHIDYIKRRAQQSKKYFSITAPKTDSAREKMITHYKMKWGVSSVDTHRVCSILEFSPGRVYMFSKQFLMCTGGRVLPSSETSAIIDELIGQDSASMVAMRIVHSSPVNTTFSPDFNSGVLGFLLMVVNDSIVVNDALHVGVTQPSQISKDTGIPVFRVLRCLDMATKNSFKALSRFQDTITWGYQHQTEPGLMSTLSRVWGA